MISRYVVLTIALFGLLVPPFGAWAQDGSATVEGTVQTAAGEGLPGANVFLEGTPLGDAADEEGHFAITGVAPGAYTLRASSVGYTSQAKDVTVRAGVTQAVDFALAPEVYSTGEGVVVTATRTEQAVSTAPASISVVSGAELEERPVGDLTDAIRGLPGVYISGSSGERSISIRGLSSSYTLILVDGKRINSSQLIFRGNDFDLNQVPVSNIERVEVVRGSMSALYGSEALGGVINIITKPVAEEWSGSMGATFQAPFEGDGGQEYRTSARVSGPLVDDALALTVSGGVSQRNNWYAFPDAPVTGRDGEPVMVNGEALSQADLSTQGARSDYSARTTLTWTPTDAQTVDVQYAAESQTRRSQRYTRSYFDSESRVTRHKGTLRHEGDWDWGDSQVKAYGEQITLMNGANVTNAIADGNVNTELAFNQLTFGGEARWAEINDNPDYETGETGFHQQAVYAQDQIPLPAGLKLLLGGRLDNHENFGSRFTPRGYLVWSATDALVFKGGVGTAFKAPSLTNLTPGFQVPSCQGGCIIIGNESLEPETSTNYEVSANYSSPAGWGVSLTGYRNEVDDLINRDLSDAGQIGEVDGVPAYTFVNVAEATIQGLETTARATLFDALRLRGSYSYIDAQDATEDRAVAYQPSHLASGEASWLLPGQGTSLRLRGQYVGEQVFYSRGGASGALEAYAIFDLGFTHGLTDTVDINGGMLNVFDRRLDEESVQNGFVERGRSAYLGLNVKF